MRQYLATAPAWVAMTITQALYVVVLTIAWATGDSHWSWLFAFVFASLTAAACAPFTWRSICRSGEAVASITGPLTREQHRVVRRAAARGVAPTDPTLHRPALDLAEYQLEKALRERARMIVLAAVGAVVSALLATSNQSWWFAVCTLALAESLIETLIYPARQRRRISQLEKAGPLAAGSAASV